MSTVGIPRLRFGYGSNGFTNHRLADAVAVLAELGYDGIALTPDAGHLDPYTPGLARRVGKLAAQLDRLGMAATVETGARFVLNPRRKHSPTLLDDDPAPRLDYLSRCIRIAADLGAPTVSLWSGAAPEGVETEKLWRRLAEGCLRARDTAVEHGIAVGFEPEPGMFVDTIVGYTELRERLGGPPGFGIALDVGHCQCLEANSPAECVRVVGGELVAVQIEDMRRGVHEHLEPGQGEIDFPAVLAALADAGYRGLVGVELPRHGHAAPAAAEHALRFLRSKEEHAH